MSFVRVLQRPPRCITSLTRRLVSTNTSISSTTTKKPVSQSSSSSSSSSPNQIQIQIPTSSCQENTTLEGLNYLKGQSPVLALKDEEYPEWLWDILNVKVYKDDGPGGKKERVERRKLNKQVIKDRNFMSTQ